MEVEKYSGPRLEAASILEPIFLYWFVYFGLLGLGQSL